MKDGAQGKMLLNAIQEFMPHYPLNDEFTQSLPKDLRKIFDAHQAGGTKEEGQKREASVGVKP